MLEEITFSAAPAMSREFQIKSIKAEDLGHHQTQLFNMRPSPKDDKHDWEPCFTKVDGGLKKNIS